VILPRWLLRTGWALHRGIHAASGGRLGTLRPNARGLGTLFVETTGRRSGAPRRTGLYYVEDGPNLVIVASNAGADRDPAWWLNLQAHPDASVDVGGGRRSVKGRAAVGDERSRLWARWREIDKKLDAYAALRSSETAVVVLERQPDHPA
jgi:deazaflavin-dependent oxidoreductase (nitroreductase family)